MVISEESLIARVQLGDEAAFGELIERYQKQVFNIALRYVHNYDDASDITQEVFIKAYRSVSGFKGKSRISTWLYRIAVNMCLDFIRREKVHSRGLVPLEIKDDEDGDYELPAPDFSYAPEQVAEQRELQEALQKALDSLPPISREIVMMRDINGMSYQEIADALHIELGTVRSRLARARIRMRNKLIKMI